MTTQNLLFNEEPNTKTFRRQLKKAIFEKIKNSTMEKEITIKELASYVEESYPISKAIPKNSKFKKSIAYNQVTTVVSYLRMIGICYAPNGSIYPSGLIKSLGFENFMKLINFINKNKILKKSKKQVINSCEFIQMAKNIHLDFLAIEKNRKKNYEQPTLEILPIKNIETVKPIIPNVSLKTTVDLKKSIQKANLAIDQATKEFNQKLKEEMIAKLTLEYEQNLRKLLQ